MAYDDTKCPCGGHKLAGTMLCSACEAYTASTPEMALLRDEQVSPQGRRSAAIRLLAMSRRRTLLPAKP